MRRRSRRSPTLGCSGPAAAWMRPAFESAGGVPGRLGAIGSATMHSHSDGADQARSTTIGRGWPRMTPADAPTDGGSLHALHGLHALHAMHGLPLPSGVVQSVQRPPPGAAASRRAAWGEPNRPCAPFAPSHPWEDPHSGQQASGSACPGLRPPPARSLGESSVSSRVGRIASSLGVAGPGSRAGQSISWFQTDRSGPLACSGWFASVSLEWFHIIESACTTSPGALGSRTRAAGSAIFPGRRSRQS